MLNLWWTMVNLCLIYDWHYDSLIIQPWILVNQLLGAACRESHCTTVPGSRPAKASQARDTRSGPNSVWSLPFDWLCIHQDLWIYLSIYHSNSIHIYHIYHIHHIHLQHGLLPLSNGESCITRKYNNKATIDFFVRGSHGNKFSASTIEYETIVLSGVVHGQFQWTTQRFTKLRFLSGKAPIHADTVFSLAHVVDPENPQPVNSGQLKP